MGSAEPRNGRGRFFVLDGVDGCGKSTQAARLARRLSRPGAPAVHLREPGSTGLGERLRSLLLSPEDPAIGPPAQVLLFAAARRQMLDEVVRPALDEGRDVVCERFNPSTYAYQAVAGELDREEVLGLLEGWSSQPAPDRILVLTLDQVLAASRTGADGDRFENRDVAFQAQVAAGFREYAERYPATVREIDAHGDRDEVEARIWAEVSDVR